MAGLRKSGIRRRLRSAFGQATAQSPDSVSGEYERLAFDAAQRALDKQERLLEELRNRTGILLAAAALAASFLGREAFGGDPARGLAIAALASLVIAIGSSIYILVPKADRFVFAVVGSGLYEGLYDKRKPPTLFQR